MNILKNPLFLILIGAFLIRLVSINQSLWIDEATSLNTAKEFSYSSIITEFARGDFHPPLYYLVLKFWLNIFGTGEINARMLSVVFCLGLIYLLAKIGKISAAILAATSPLLIYYSQEARMYMLSALLVCLLVYHYQKLKNKESVLLWLSFSLTILFLGATDYLPLLTIPVLMADAVLRKMDLKWWLKFLASLLPLVLLLYFWLPILQSQISAGLSVQASSPVWWKVLGSPSLKEVLLLPVKFALGRISFANKYLYIVSLVGVLTLITIPLTKIIKKARLFWFWMVFPPLAALIMSFRIPVFSYFRFLFVLPALYILISIGLTKLKPRISRVILISLVCLNLIFSSIYLLNPNFQKENWRGLVEFLDATRDKQSSLVLFPANSQMEAYHYYAKDSQYAGGSNAVSSNFQEIWLVRYAQEISDPADDTRRKVEELGYHKIIEYNFNRIGVWLYK